MPSHLMIPSDVIDLTLVDANAGVTGDQGFTWRGKAAFNAPGQIRWFASGTDRIIAGSTDGDRRPSSRSR